MCTEDEGEDNMNEIMYYPLTYTQKRVYYSEKASEASKHQGASMYTIGGFVEFEGMADLEVLGKAIIKMLKTYDTFQIRLVETDSGIMQYFDDKEEEKIPLLDLQCPEYEYTNIATWCEEKFKESFPAEEKKPLYYFCVWKAKGEKSGYFFKLHHIIADGWSVSLLMKTVAEYYNLLIEESEAVIEPERMEYSYLNFINSEKKYHNSKIIERDRQFWMDTFKDIPEPLFEVRSNKNEGKRKEYTFSPYTKSILCQVVEKYKLTVPAVVSALTAIYFMRFYKKDEIVLGIPVYNREKTTKKVCGLFTSNALLRIALREDTTLADYAAYVKRELNQCYYHQRYPYDQIIQDIDLRKTGRMMLYQVSVNYYNTEMDNDFHGMKERNYELYSGQQFYPLQIVVKDWKDIEGLTLLTDYQTEYFTESQMDDFMAFLEEGIYLFGMQPDICLRNISVVANKCRNELIMGYNSYEQEKPITETVLLKFEKQVQLHPDRKAVSYQNEFLTYQELDEKAEHLAAYLQERYGKSQQIAAVLTSHCMEYVIAVVAVLKAGYAFLPIDKECPENRVQYMLEDTKATVLLTDQEEYRTKKMPLEVLDLKDKVLYEPQKSCAVREDSLDALAYVIYTSGSTGKPKGVLVGQKSFRNYIEYAVDTYIKGEDDVFAFFTSIAFDLTITSVFTPLASGTQIRVFGKNQKQYGLYDIVQDNQATIIKLTPSHLNLLNECDLTDSVIRTMILGGENLLAATVNSTYQAFGRKVDIYNEYGPTEATVGCMTFLSGKTKNSRYSEPIGYPIRNTQLYILDEKQRLLPKGAAGELYIAGDCLAFGYLNKPEATQKAFVTHFMDPSKKMYRTGDFVRLLANGTMEYIGRGNDYIKFKGYRIETDEIEKTILASGEVKSAVAICLSEGSEQGIYAFVTGEQVDRKRIQRYCEKYLPEYMIPQWIEEVEQIPLNQNGKVDHKKLAKLVQEQADKRIESLKQDDKTKTFLAVFEQVLKKNPIELSDNFFTLGGDSIKAIQVSGMFKKMNLNIPVGEILNYPDLSELYEHFSTACVAKAEEKEQEADTEEEIKLTPVMKQYFETLYQEQTFYNQSVLLTLHQKTDIEDLNQSLKQIVAAHSMLRIRYDKETKRLIKRKMEKQDEEIVEFKKIPFTEKSQQIDCMCEAAGTLKQSISLDKGIVCRGLLCELPTGKQYLYVTIHHLCMDGVSWRILLDDLAVLLAGKREGKEENIIRTDSFLKWADAVSKNGASWFEGEKEFWNQMMNKGTSYNIGTRLVRYQDVKRETVSLESYRTAKFLQNASECYHMRPDELLLSILAYCFMKKDAHDSVLIMTESHGRDDELSGLNTSRTIGWFTSIYPVLLEGNQEEKLVKLLPKLKEQMRRIKHYGIGFGVHKWLEHSIPAPQERTVCFNYLGDFEKILDNELFSYAGEDMGENYSRQLVYPYYLEVNAMVVSGSLRVEFGYADEDNIDASVSELIHRFVEYLEEFSKEVKEDEVILTPSDFSAVQLSPEDLDMLFDDEEEEDE